MGVIKSTMFAIWVLASSLAVNRDFFFGELTASPPMVALLLVGFVWLGLMLFIVAIGWPQSKEANSSFWRLCWLSAFLGLVGAMPVIVVALFITWGALTEDQFRVAALSTILNMASIACSLLPPVRLRGTKEKLPLVTDEPFLQRVRTLAERMRIPVPLVRLWPSITGTQQALAFAGTLQAPQLVVTDGILNRLDSAESDAIVAHELAHIANGSLLLFAAVIPISGAVTTAVTFCLPLSLALPFGVAFFVGFRRMVSRPIEFDCDHRAAQVIGYRTTASALAKIHSVHPVSNTGFVSRLLYATATHPPRDARLAALYDKSPADDRPDGVPDRANIRIHHGMAVVAAWVWGLVLVGTLAMSIPGYDAGWLIVPLWIIALLPTVLIRMAIQKQVQTARQRTGDKWRLLALLGLGSAIALSLVVLIVVLIFVLNGPVEAGKPDEVDSLGLVSGLILFLVIISGLGLRQLATRKRRKLQHAVDVALQLHDFRRVRELCLAVPKIVQGDHKLRYNQGLAAAITGDRKAAIDELEQLWADKPRFLLTPLALGELLLDSDQAERATEFVDRIRQQLPNDAAVPLLESRLLRRLGRIDEAQAACERGLKFEPHNGCLCAVSAAIELDRGHLESAEKQIQQALELAPGEPYALVVRAEITARAESPEQARLAVTRAVQAIQANPLVFLQTEIKRLESMIDI